VSTFHLGGLVAGRDQLARVDWCCEGALSGQRKSYQASSRLRGAAGCQGCTFSCCLPLTLVMRGRKSSERGLRGCAHSRRADGCRPGKGLLVRNIAEVGLSRTVPPLKTSIDRPSDFVAKVVSSSPVTPCTIARPSGTATPALLPPLPTAFPFTSRCAVQTPRTRFETAQSGFPEAVKPLGPKYARM